MILRSILVLVVFALSACDQTVAERSVDAVLESASDSFVVPNPMPQLNALNYALPESAVDSDELPNVVLQSAAKASPLPYYEIARDTYLLFGNVGRVDRQNRGFNSNAGFVVTSTGVVLIDALGTPMLGERLIATVTSVTDKPITHLILTSLQPSHSLGSSAIARLPGVEVIAATQMTTLDYSPDLLQPFYELLPEEMQGRQAVAISHRIAAPRQSYETLSVGEHTFEIYNLGEVYAGGGLMVHQVDDDILWLSDLASNQVIPDLSGADLDLRRQTLDWLQEHFAEVELMVPGHGSAQSSPFLMLEQNLRYLDNLDEAVHRALASGLSLSETLPQATLAAWSEWHLYDQHHQANVTVLYQRLKKAQSSVQ